MPPNYRSKLITAKHRREPNKQLKRVDAFVLFCRKRLCVSVSFMSCRVPSLSMCSQDTMFYDLLLCGTHPSSTASLTLMLWLTEGGRAAEAGDLAYDNDGNTCPILFC